MLFDKDRQHPYLKLKQRFSRYAIAPTIMVIGLAGCAGIADVEKVEATVSHAKLGPAFHACMKREGAYSNPALISSHIPGTGEQVTVAAEYAMSLTGITLRDGIGNRYERCALMTLGNDAGPKAEQSLTGYAAEALVSPSVADKIATAARARNIDPETHIQNFKTSLAEFLNDEMRAFYTLEVSTQPMVIDSPNLTAAGLPAGVLVTSEQSKTANTSESNTSSAQGTIARANSAEQADQSQAVTAVNYQQQMTRRSFWQPTLNAEPFTVNFDKILLWRGGWADSVKVKVLLKRTSRFQREVRRSLRSAENGISAVEGALSSRASTYLSGDFPAIAQLGGALIGDLGQAIVSKIDDKLEAQIQSRSVVISGEWQLYTAARSAPDTSIGLHEQLRAGANNRICVIASLPPGIDESNSPSDANCTPHGSQRLLFSAQLETRLEELR